MYLSYQLSLAAQTEVLSISCGKAPVRDNLGIDQYIIYAYYMVTQLACFCASAGASQWAALHHLMEYRKANPSFTITYWQNDSADWVRRFGLGQ